MRIGYKPHWEPMIDMETASLAIAEEPPAASKIMEKKADRMDDAIGTPRASAPPLTPVCAKRT